MDWTRRSRGAWAWPDGVDAPLHEQAEAYFVTYGPLNAPAAIWDVAEPHANIGAARRGQLAAILPGEAFRVRQRGTYGLSDHLVLTYLP